MEHRTFLLLFVLLMLMACSTKKEKEVKNMEVAPPETETTVKENQPTEVDFTGLWKTMNDTLEATVELYKDSLGYNGIMTYKEFDDNKELRSSIGVASVVGKLEGSILKVDIYDPKGRKASEAFFTIEGDNLMFKRIGQKVNLPDAFTVAKVNVDVGG